MAQPGQQQRGGGACGAGADYDDIVDIMNIVNIMAAVGTHGMSLRFGGVAVEVS